MAKHNPLRRPAVLATLLFVCSYGAACSPQPQDTSPAADAAVRSSSYYPGSGQEDGGDVDGSNEAVAKHGAPSKAPLPANDAAPEQLRGLGYLADAGRDSSAAQTGSAYPAPPPSIRQNERKTRAAAKPSSELYASQPAGTPMAAPSRERFHEADTFAGGVPSPAPPQRDDNTERYQHLEDNPLRLVATDPVSTFSLDVDTGSYSNVRRFLVEGRRPPQDAVRVEELVNYFPYDYPPSNGQDPFGVRTEMAPCPWNTDHWLMRVAVRADQVDAQSMPAANLVFLVDVSGSMDDPKKLPLLRSSLKLLVAQLRGQDRVSLVVYAGREAVVLEPTPGDQHAKIERAIDDLQPDGSTAGEAGIRLAYRMARQGFINGGINRVLLATDGDFNVGITDFEQVKDLVERERESGVQLSTLGFGTGNYHEHLMEQLADVGNGSYAYIDTLTEGRKVLVDQMRSTLVTVAKDVKVQVEFNPAAVSEYRLIGYENRVLTTEDFNNDKIDAGDVGAGQSVTALYELTPAGAKPSVDPLRYGSAEAGADAARPAATPPAAEIAFVKLRYKAPAGTTSKLVEVPVSRSSLLASFAQAGDDFRFATAVAGFGQLLRGGKRSGTWSLDDVLATATDSRGRDEFGYRREFVSLVRMAKVSG